MTSEAKFIRKLKAYLKKNQDVLLAFVFGSYAKGYEGQDSDLDIALYLKDKKNQARIYLELTKITERNIDIVLLNNAPACLISSIFKTGIPIIIKDRQIYWDLYLRKTLEAEDFSRFVQDYYEVCLRSRSLIPEDKARLIMRIQYLKAEFDEVGSFKNLSFKEYTTDKLKKRNLERWTENIINATLDIAKIILASEQKEVPKTYEQALFNFGCFIGLQDKDAEVFASFSHLRNILAHEYLEIIYDQIREFIVQSEHIYNKIFEFLDKYLKDK